MERKAKKTGKELAFDFFESNFKDVLSRNPILEARIDAFMKNVALKFQTPQVNLIRRAIVVGAVAHQNNKIESKRNRKTGNNGGNPTPYFIHPLEMAECMVSPSNENPTFDWITIAATLLHDVPEDVKFYGIEGKEAWSTTIEGIFKDSGYQYMLTSIIDGVTERKLPNRNENTETEKLYQRLEGTPMYKMIASYIQKGGIRSTKETVSHIYGEDRKSIAEVVYNLEHLFFSATQTPEELRIFFIKIADVWHNLQSPEWIKNYKILRGRIAAGLADLLGWNLMKDKIIVSLAKITDVTAPFSPHIDKNKVLFSEELEPLAKEAISSGVNIIKAIIPQILKEPLTNFIKIKGGYPLSHTGHKITTLNTEDGEKTTLPQPEVQVTIPTEQIEKIRQIFGDTGYINVKINDSRNKRGYSFTKINHKGGEDLSERLANLLGRKRIDFIISPGNRNSFTLRIEDDQPHIIDMFTSQHNKIALDQIPELGLLHNDFFQENILLSNTHIQALIGFCYEPSLIGQAGEGIVPVFHFASGRLFFLPKTLSVKEASDICGIPELEQSYSGQTLWDLYDTKYKLSQALRRIIKV